MSNEQTRLGESLPTPAQAVRVVPQELWDVGLSLQHLRDVLFAVSADMAGSVAAVSGMDVADDLTEVSASWQLLRSALTDPALGLHTQISQIVTALDEMMLNLRTSIVAYEVSEAQSADRLRAIGESAR